MKNRKTSIIALVALLVVALVGSTVAYWTQTSTIDNPFETGKQYGSTIVEKFTPKDGEDWLPGVEVAKEVSVSNDGDTDILVRAKLTETWKYKGANSFYIDLKGKDPYMVQQAGDVAGKTDGKTDGDKSVVKKNIAKNGKWTDAGDDGWCYYTENLTKGQTTAEWLQSVELDKDTDMGAPKTTFYVAVDADGKTWYELAGNLDKAPKYVTINGGVATAADKDTTDAKPVTYGKHEIKIDPTAKGYSDSEYVLTVTVQTVQATQEAVDATFGGGGTFTAPQGCNWKLR